MLWKEFLRRNFCVRKSISLSANKSILQGCTIVRGVQTIDSRIQTYGTPVQAHTSTGESLAGLFGGRQHERHCDVAKIRRDETECE